MKKKNVVKLLVAFALSLAMLCSVNTASKADVIPLENPQIISATPLPPGSGVKLHLTFPDQVKGHYENLEDYECIRVQIDWKFTENDDWKYSDSWDSLAAAKDESRYEYVDLVINSEDDMNTLVYSIINDIPYGTKSSAYTDEDCGYVNVIPASRFISFAYDSNTVNETIDWNKYALDIRARFVYQKEFYSEDLHGYVYDYECSDWSDTVTFGNFSKDYDEPDNLLVNPDFEEGLNGWQDPDRVWYARSAGDGGYENNIYAARHGRFLAWPYEGASKSLSKTRIYQDVSLEDYKAGDTVVFNTLICNYDQPPYDMGKVVLSFYDKDDKIIEQSSQAQRNPNWNSQSVIVGIPEGAVKVRVSLYAYLYVGGDIDAYYDYCSLTVKPEKVNRVSVTEKSNASKAKEGDKFTLVADNGTTRDASAYTWSSSYNEAATVDANGVVTFLTDAEDGVAIYARDNNSGVTGVYWFNSDEVNDKNTEPETTVKKPQKASVKSVTKAAKAFTVKWKKVSGAEGYQIRYSTSSKMTNAKLVTIKKASTVSKKITGLKGGKKYYIQIRTYITVDGKKVYSDWSAKKSVTTKK